jgi:hypothetical protein
VQKAARRPCRVAKTLIMGQRLAWLSLQLQR